MARQSRQVRQERRGACLGQDVNIRQATSAFPSTESTVRAFQAVAAYYKSFHLHKFSINIQVR